MPTFIKKYQNIIHSNDAIKLGRKEVAEATGVVLTDFMNDILDNVMPTTDKSYLIQWAISELTEEEVRDATKERG